MKLSNKKGFTLMEMLIVVAIIAILVAIAIPTLTNQLEKARETADIANIRSAYAEAMVQYLDINAGGSSVVVETKAMTQTVEGWDKVDATNVAGYDLKTGSNAISPVKNDIVTVTIDNTGAVEFAIKG